VLEEVVKALVAPGVEGPPLAFAEVDRGAPKKSDIVAELGVSVSVTVDGRMTTAVDTLVKVATDATMDVDSGAAAEDGQGTPNTIDKLVRQKRNTLTEISGVD
jgi:hypothetical protein